LVKRIKFLSKTPVAKMAPLWEALAPKGHFRDLFTFDPDDREYDFLVIYEDLPPRDGERKIYRSEQLACSKKCTLLITTEPSSIRIDGLNYLSQFGEVWTSRPFDWKTIFDLDARGCRVNNLPLTAPPRHYAHHQALINRRRQGDHPPPLRWFYGRDMEGSNHLTLEQITDEIPDKTRDLSTVTSNKAMKHTVHSRRLEFVTALKKRLGENLSLYGRGFHDVRDKRDAMKDYRYHIAIENHVQAGHYTEKLTDCFLALSLPFYFGAPDYDKYYPRDAVIPIDIFDLDKSEKIIREAIATHQYEKRLPALRNAKSLALSASCPLMRAQQWTQRVEKCDDFRADAQFLENKTIHGRHAFRRSHPLQAAQDAIYRARMRRHPSSSPMQG
jgi:hypothetical protein